MRSEEFLSYQEYFIEDYGHELANNYGYSLASSLRKAREELSEDLPLGVATPGNNLLCLEVSKEEGTTLVGYLWYALEEDGATAFIYDFYTFREYRNQGYGTGAMAVLERQWHSDGVEQIKLRVAYNNKRALSLYKRLGFDVTGHNMIKKLKT